jgi:hypothetical protein
MVEAVLVLHTCKEAQRLSTRLLAAARVISRVRRLSDGGKSEPTAAILDPEGVDNDRNQTVLRVCRPQKTERALLELRHERVERSVTCPSVTAAGAR